MGRGDYEHAHIGIGRDRHAYRGNRVDRYARDHYARVGRDERRHRFVERRERSLPPPPSPYRAEKSKSRVASNLGKAPQEYSRDRNDEKCNENRVSHSKCSPRNIEKCDEQRFPKPPGLTQRSGNRAFKPSDETNSRLLRDQRVEKRSHEEFPMPALPPPVATNYAEAVCGVGRQARYRTGSDRRYGFMADIYFVCEQPFLSTWLTKCGEDEIHSNRFWYRVAYSRARLTSSSSQVVEIEGNLSACPRYFGKNFKCFCRFL